MRHPFKFVVSPLKGENYIREREGIIVNVGIENAKYVNRYGIVEELPYTYIGNIKRGDTVIVHHNVFRDVYDVDGNFRESNSKVENKFLILDSNIFLYKTDKVWKTNLDYCFVAPPQKEFVKTFPDRSGFIRFSNKIKGGTLVGFTPESEYEFVIDGELMYKMSDSDISIVYEEPEW